MNRFIKKASVIGLLLASTSLCAMENAAPYFADNSPSEETEEAYSEEDGVITLPRVHFSPHIREVLKVLISREKTGIQAAHYLFTLYDVAQVWADRAQKHAFASSLIVDQKYNKNFREGLELLHNNGVTVQVVTKARSLKSPFKTRPDGFEIMHHKFWIFANNIEDKELVMVGSYNPTGQASECNWENSVLIDDPKVIKEFKKRFVLIKQHAQRLRARQLSVKERKSDFVKKLNGIGVAPQPVKWKEQKILLAPYPVDGEGNTLTPLTRVRFSPDIRGFLCNLIAQENKGIICAMYRFSLEDVARTWSKRHKEKQLASSLYLDEDFKDEQYKKELLEAVHELHKAGITLYAVTKHRTHTPSSYAPKEGKYVTMHHKFYIFEENQKGRPLLLTGSFNNTGHANEYHWEDMIVTDDAGSIECFREEIARLAKCAEPASVSALELKSRQKSLKAWQLKSKRKLNGGK